MNQLHLQFKKAAGGGVGGLDLHLEHEGDPFMCVSSINKMEKFLETQNTKSWFKKMENQSNPVTDK